jgi:hypothetical protein
MNKYLKPSVSSDERKSVLLVLLDNSTFISHCHGTGVSIGKSGTYSKFNTAENRTECKNTPECIEKVSDDERFSPNKGIFNFPLQRGVVMQKDHKTSL